MKRRLLLTILSCASVLSASAQSPTLFTSSEYIDISNIRAAHLLHGDMWWDPATGTPQCEYPKGSGKHVGFTSNIWLAAYDNSNALHVAAQTYRQKGVDFWPGPIDSGSTSVSYATSQKWARIWKVNRTTIDSFRQYSSHTISNTPLSILEWPAKGNPYAKGAGGAALSVTKAMAPFVDVNNDGNYNPLAGDYPRIKGDQMLWWIINDAGPTHTASAAMPLLVDIQISAYAYKRGTAIDNVIFYEYDITTKGSSIFRDFTIGFHADFDLSTSDYTGFDSSHRMGFNYGNSTVQPTAGLAVLDIGDSATGYLPLGSYMSFANGGGANGDPTNGLEYYRLMTSHNRAGTPLANGMRYQYNVDSECVNNHVPGDRRFVTATPIFLVYPGTTFNIATALIIAPSTGCPVMNLDSLYHTADSAFKYYWHPPANSLPNSIRGERVSALRLFPNPATSSVCIETGTTTTGVVQVYDAFGRSVSVSQTFQAGKLQLNIATLPAGVYNIRYQDGIGMKSGLFIKE